MKSAFGYMTLRGCTLGYALALTLAAGPAAAQSTWFGAQQSAAVDDPKAVACLALALGGPVDAQDIDPPNGLARAAAQFNVSVVIDAVRSAALRFTLFPRSPK